MELFKTAVIMAGGKSSRMGFDKQFLSIYNERIINYLINELRKEFEEIIIVTNKVEEYKEYDVKLLSDEIKEKGPLSGLHIGLKASSSKYTYFIACDMPNLDMDYIRFMKERIGNLDIDACVTKTGKNIEPFNAFYSGSLINYIEKLLMKEFNSLSYLIKSINTFYIKEKEAREFSPDLSMFFNLNTIEDVENYLSGISGFRSKWH